MLQHLVPAFLLATTLAAQNCGNTSIGTVPLNDLGTGTYQGFVGGFYANGQNVPPPAHEALGLMRMADVVPRNGTGAPAANGRIVVLSLGMSNTTQEFSTWVSQSNADPNRNPSVQVVDGAQGGQDAVTIANPNANFWNVVDQRLANAGVTPQQVQVVWLKEAIAGVNGGFVAAATQLQGLLAQIARNVTARYPNVRLCFCSSRTYAGYATTALNPEPYAYESGFAVKWLIEQQVAGDPQLNADPSSGPVVAPWIGFGAYLWTDGLTPRSDGLVWECADVQPDGTHPSPSGRVKVAALLQQFFTTNSLTVPWYVGSGSAALFGLYGQGCVGSNGVPLMRSNSLPFVGNAQFRLGVADTVPGALVALAFGNAPAQVPIVAPCDLLVEVSAGLPLTIGFANANGAHITSVPIANVPALVGVELYCQWLVNDPMGAPLPGFAGLATSRGGKLTVGL